MRSVVAIIRLSAAVAGLISLILEEYRLKCLSVTRKYYEISWPFWLPLTRILMKTMKTCFEMPMMKIKTCFRLATAIENNI